MATAGLNTSPWIDSVRLTYLVDRHGHKKGFLVRILDVKARLWSKTASSSHMSRAKVWGSPNMSQKWLAFCYR